MARQARGEYLDPSEVQVVHAVQRCVRRAFLCGRDPLTGKSFEHRRQWIRDRLEFLASVFGVDCLTYTVMSNHLHVVLRSSAGCGEGMVRRRCGSAVGGGCFRNGGTRTRPRPNRTTMSSR